MAEIRESWSLDDLADAHEALDIQDEVQELQAEKAREDSRKKRG